MPKKYELPEFLVEIQSQSSYERWLDRKAAAHLRRDRQRGNTVSTRAEYKLAIHAAVRESGGKDVYTNEALDWKLLGCYDNEESKRHRRDYKKKFALLPSVDHVGDGLGPADFKICGWRTNDCKNDLELSELIEFCRLILNVHDPRA